MWNVRTFTYWEFYQAQEWESLDYQIQHELQGQECHIHYYLHSMQKLLRWSDPKPQKKSNFT